MWTSARDPQSFSDPWAQECKGDRGSGTPRPCRAKYIELLILLIRTVMGVNGREGQKAPGPVLGTQDVQVRVARGPSGPGRLHPLSDGRAGLLGPGWGSTRQEDLGRGTGMGPSWGLAEGVGQSAPWTAPAWLRPRCLLQAALGGCALSRPGSAGRSAEPFAGRPLPRQPAGGGRPRADGRGTPSQFAAPTATRRGGGPGGRGGQSARDLRACPPRGLRLSRGWGRSRRQMKRKRL